MSLLKRQSMTSSTNFLNKIPTELKILTKSPLTPLFQRGEPIVIPLCLSLAGKRLTKGDNYPSLWQREVGRDLKKLLVRGNISFQL